MKIVFAGKEKKRLDVYLHEQIPDLSRSRIQKMIKQGSVTLNSAATSVHHWLHTNDEITVNREDTPEPIAETKETEAPLTIFVCTDYAIIQKPAGMLVHPTNQNESHTLVSWLRNTFPQAATIGDPERPGIVHRLDKDVGGLMIVVLSQNSYDYFRNLFRDRQIEKHYWCLVHGKMRNDEGTIDTPIARNRETGKMVAQSATGSGKTAYTIYRVHRRFAAYTLLDVQIITGRTHQIRTHLYSIGHSIVGDVLYQTKNVRKRSRGNDILDQPFLFAYQLSFTDPAGENKVFSTDLPHNLTLALSTLTPQ